MRLGTTLRVVLRVLKLDTRIGAIGNWPKGFVEDSYDWEQEGYDEVEKKVDTIFEVKTKDRGVYAQKTTAIMSGKLVEATQEQESTTFRRPSEGFTAYAIQRKFHDGVTLTQEEVEFFPPEHTRDLLQDHMTSWGQKLALTEEDHGALLFTKGGFTAGHTSFRNVLSAGFLSQNTDNLAYDAKPFFNRQGNERTSKGGGTYYNAITGGLTLANYATLYKRIFVTNAKDERDERVSLKLGQIGLVVPPQLRDAGFQVLETEHLPGTDQNDRNPWYKTATPVEWDAINANANTWYLGVLKKGITFYRWGKPEIRTFRDEDNGAYKSTIRAYFGWMAWQWRFWGGSEVPTS